MTVNADGQRPLDGDGCRPSHPDMNCFGRAVVLRQEVAVGSDWDRLVQAAEADPGVVGLVLTGGRGKGVSGPGSDWDAIVVVVPAAAERWRDHRGAGIDLTVLTAAEFAVHGEPGTGTAWRGYDLAGLTAAIDRGGVQAALDRKGTLTPTVARRVAEANVDHVLNQLYRAVKNDRAGDSYAVGLDLAELVPPWLTAMFAFEGRHRPYNKFLRRELTARPLSQLILTTEELLDTLDRTLHDCDISAAWRLCTQLATAAEAAGVTDALESWRDHLRELDPDWPVTSGGGG